MIIYKATNKINGKVYIGKTTNSLEERIKGHIFNSIKPYSHFTKALAKYGPENFSWEILCDAKGKPKDVLDALEIYYIAKHRLILGSYNVYNMTKGGDGGDTFSGKKHSKETKKKISEAHKGNCISEETKKKISESKKGKPAWNKGVSRTEEEKKKIKEATKIAMANLSQEKKDKIKEGRSKPWSEETRIKHQNSFLLKQQENTNGNQAVQ
jgi:group I intron endonuclease